MTYEMDKVVNLLRKEFSQVHINQSKQSLEYLRAVYPIISAYINNGHIHLRELLVHNATDRLTALVPLYQRDITRGLDILKHYHSDTGIREKRTTKLRIQKCFGRLIYQLKRLLEYIFTDFADYYNSHQKIPRYVKDVFERLFEEDKQMVLKWATKQVIDVGLITQLVKPFTDYLACREETSHVRLAYLRQYSNRIRNLAEISEPSDKVILEFLISMRYNTDECVKVCITSIQNRANNIQLPPGPRQFYERSILLVRRLRIEGLANYNACLPEIEMRICDYLAAEISSIENEIPDKLKSDHSTKEHLSHEKITLAWSVQEACFLLRLMIDAGYIVSDNYLAAMRVTIKTFNVKRYDQLSFKSVRNKFYNVEPATVRNLKGKLLDLVNKTNNY